MSSNLLILTPADPFFAAAPGELIACLKEAGFIGAPQPQPGFYKPGAKFFHFITFLGCSPVVALGEPGATAEICRIEISVPLAAPLFLAGDNLKEPRCPGCGYRSPEGRAIGAAWQQDPANHRWTCPACGHAYAAPQLRWRHSAGFGRTFLKVWGVFEAEAVPSEHLSRLLAGFGDKEWQAFYLQI